MKFKKIVKEARLPVMWAIDYRDFHTAIHGLIYGKSRRDVEEFYDRLKAIYDDKEISSDYQEMYYQDLWDEFYPRIQQIDEIDFRDIGKLPSGKYGIIVDDVEYRLVNPMSAIDIYEESTKRNNKMKFKKIVNEEVDIGWDLEARRDDRNREIREHQKWNDEELIFNGRPMKRKNVIMRLRAAISDREDEGYDISPLTAAIHKAQEIDAGERLDFPKLQKVVKESDEGGSDHPRIYVGTYAKYNNGSIDGKWIDISEYNDYEEFVDACRELHSDEDDPEFMVQDYENFPRKWYHEGGLPTEEEFDKINDYYLMSDTEQRAYEAYVNYTDDDDIDNFHEAYQGEYDSASDFAYSLVDDLGWDGIGSDNLDMYFDYDAFGRDLMMDFHFGDEDNEDAEGNPEDPDHYYDNDGYDMGEYQSDSQVAEDYISNIGGVDQLGADTARNYFDYEAFGRDLLMSDYFEEDGFVFRHL